MISKQEFLNTVRDQIFPILSGYQGKINKQMRLVIIVPIISFLLAIFLAFLYAILSNRPNAAGFALFFFSPVIITVVTWIVSSRYCSKIESMIKPKVFSLLGLDENNTEENPLEELSDTGIFSRFNREMIDDSFAIRGTRHSLFIQEVDLEHSSGKDCSDIFSGVIIAAKQLHPKNFSLLLLDKKIRENRSKFELTNKIFSKFTGTKIPWQKIEEKSLNKDFSVYTDNPQSCLKYLTPAFMSVIEELKSGDKEPLNILFYRGKIFLAISTKRDLFECINWKNCLDIKPYIQLYDDIQSLYRVDELLTNLEMF